MADVLALEGFVRWFLSFIVSFFWNALMLHPSIDAHYDGESHEEAVKKTIATHTLPLLWRSPDCKGSWVQDQANSKFLVLLPPTLRVEVQGSLGCFKQQLLEFLNLALYDIQSFSTSYKLASKYLSRAKFVHGHIQTHPKMLPWLRLEHVKVNPAAALVEKVHNKLQKTDVKTASRSTNLTEIDLNCGDVVDLSTVAHLRNL